MPGTPPAFVSAAAAVSVAEAPPQTQVAADKSGIATAATPAEGGSAGSPRSNTPPLTPSGMLTPAMLGSMAWQSCAAAGAAGHALHLLDTRQCAVEHVLTLMWPVYNQKPLVFHKTGRATLPEACGLSAAGGGASGGSAGDSASKRTGSPPATISSGCWKQSSSLRGHHDDVMDLAWSHDDAVVMSGSVDNEVMLFDVESRRSVVRRVC